MGHRDAPCRAPRRTGSCRRPARTAVEADRRRGSSPTNITTCGAIEIVNAVSEVRDPEREDASTTMQDGDRAGPAEPARSEPRAIERAGRGRRAPPTRARRGTRPRRSVSKTTTSRQRSGAPGRSATIAGSPARPRRRPGRPPTEVGERARTARTSTIVATSGRSPPDSAAEEAVEDRRGDDRTGSATDDRGDDGRQNPCRDRADGLADGERTPPTCAAQQRSSHQLDVDRDRDDRGRDRQAERRPSQAVRARSGRSSRPGRSGGPTATPSRSRRARQVRLRR